MDQIYVALSWFFSNSLKIAAVISLIASVIFFFLRLRFVTKKELTKALGGFNTRIVEIEDRMDTLATHKDVERLSDTLGDIKDQTIETATKVEATQESIKQIQNNIAILISSAIEKGLKR